MLGYSERLSATGTSILGTAWFGLLIGLSEIAAKGAQKFGPGLFFEPEESIRRFGIGPVVNVSKDIVWMAPLAAVTVSLILAPLVIFVARRLFRRDPLPFIVLLFTFIGALNLLYMYPRLQEYAALLLAAGIAAQMYRIASSRRELVARFIERTVWGLAAIAVVPTAVAFGFQFAKEQSAVRALRVPPQQAPNVLLVVLDTVGTRNLSVYGYERDTTPNLKRLAENGVVFDRALATAPWTLPSHAAMFTGRYGYNLSADWKVPLDGRDPTLAEQLAANGYFTAGFIANTMYCSYEFGLDRGFIHYEDYPVSLGEVVSSLTVLRNMVNRPSLRRLVKNDEELNRQSAEEINQKFLGWLGGHKDRPFFVFLNYFDAHDPYFPPPPFDRKFGEGRKNPKWSPLLRSGWDENHKRMISDAEFQEEIDAYDGAVAYLDDQLGRLFESLRSEGILDNTIVIVTGDHGEEFGEHGLYSHGNSLYLPSVHVPLLVAWPRGVPAGRRIAEPVTLRELAATVGEMSGLSFSFPGKSLARFWSDGTDHNSDSPLLSEVTHVTGRPAWLPVSKGDMRSIVADGFRYIRNGDGTEELYNFNEDPLEKTNLATQPEVSTVLENLRKQLDSFSLSKRSGS